MRHALAVPVPFGAGDAPTISILSTFPPTECGIATFAAALAAGLIASVPDVVVVRSGEAPDIEDSSVVAALVGRDPRSIADAAAALNASDVVIVQHEYGIYEGADGADLLALMAQLTVPTIVVAHTVLAQPTAHQRDVLVRVCARADAVVVMTDTARRRLVERFGVDPTKVTLIPHGAVTPAVAEPDPHDQQPAVGPVRLLTWGLLGPGKGIEWAIDAVATLTDLEPRPEYVIAGATHPKVLAIAGEAYRTMLHERAVHSAAAGHVTFDPQYRDLASLHQLIRSADIVVLPYDSVDQVTSGVLVDAIAAGRPVVSTAFPHAVELLSSGAGTVVPQGDAEALAGAIRAIVTDPARADAMAAEARRLAPDLSWQAVAARYVRLAATLSAARRPLVA